MTKVILFGDSIFNAYQNGQDTDDLLNAVKGRLGDGYEVENISQSGATTKDVLPKVGNLPKCDILVTEYGTNDAAKGWGLSLYDYQETYEKLIKEAQKITEAKHTLVLGPAMPNFDVPEMAENYSLEGLDDYTDVAERDAGKTNSYFYDLAHKMEHLQNLPTFLQEDGQHLSKKGISWLADVLVKEIKGMD